MVNSSSILSANILIVDDEPANVSLLQRTLGDAGYASIASTMNPREVCELHRKNRYTLILLDLEMPQMDGFQVMEGLRAIETESYLPVLVITAHPDHKVRALKAGAKDFVSKPLDLAEVLMRVYNMLEVRLLHLELKEKYDQILKEQKLSERLLHVFRSGPFAMSINTLVDERIIDVNDQFCKFFGYSREEIVGRNVADFNSRTDSEDRAALMQRVRSDGAIRGFEAKQRLASGEVRDVLVSLELIELAGETEPVLITMFVDVTERKQAEAQARRAQRLESIGTLAAGVAHDFNNALAPILMSVELLRLKSSDTATVYLDLIESGAKRGAGMVRQLLTFAKGTEGERMLIQPRHLLDEMQKLIRVTFPKNIELRIRCARDLQLVRGDVTQLHQVLLNLCVNARDAMPNGGTLTLEAENSELTEASPSDVPESKPGHYVVCRIVDSGTGIPPEAVDHIFEPFFTTKGPEQGTGLGLSTILGIVKSHGGFIRVSSVLGKGSTFSVYLPACGSGTAEVPLAAKTETTFRGNGQTILVVDDEVDVRDVLRDVLTNLNFKVITAADGTAALVQVAEHVAEIRLVITDVHMPHMDGLSFVRILRGKLNQTHIIVISGRLDARDANEFRRLGVKELLEKPFSTEKLVKALERIFHK